MKALYDSLSLSLGLKVSPFAIRSARLLARASARPRSVRSTGFSMLKTANTATAVPMIAGMSGISIPDIRRVILDDDNNGFGNGKERDVNLVFDLSWLP